MFEIKHTEVGSVAFGEHVTVVMVGEQVPKGTQFGDAVTTGNYKIVQRNMMLAGEGVAKRWLVCQGDQINLILEKGARLYIDGDRMWISSEDEYPCL